MYVVQMLKRMEIDMNPYTLFPLTERRVAAAVLAIIVEFSEAPAVSPCGP